MSLINTIACGDCREILPTLPAKSFQLAFADPPYWVGFDYGEKTDKEMSYVEPSWLVNELLRVAEVVMITPGSKQFYDYPRPKWLAIWHKPAAMGVNGLGGACNVEPILVYGKGQLRNDYFRAPLVPNKESDFHACPKPEKLLRQIIEWTTKAGDSVLDPFSGSGTTCKAAFQLGRNYLGIEIDPKIVELSLARLHNSQPPLLAVGGLTLPAPDGGDSAPSQSLSTPDMFSAIEHEPTPAPRR